MDRALVWALRARAVDVKTALDERMIERSDEEHLDRLGISLQRLLRLVHARSAEEMENRVEFLSAWKPA